MDPLHILQAQPSRQPQQPEEPSLQLAHVHCGAAQARGADGSFVVHSMVFMSGIAAVASLALQRSEPSAIAHDKYSSNPCTAMGLADPAA